MAESFKQYSLPDNSEQRFAEHQAIIQNQMKMKEMNERRRFEEEQLRLQRLGGRDQYVYALEQIIKKCEMENGEEIQMQMHEDLGFQNNINLFHVIEKFLGQLKQYDCLANFERISRGYFRMTKPNVKKLRAYREELIRKLSFTSTGRPIVHIDRETGVYRDDEDGKGLVYPISGKRLKMVVEFCRNESLGAKELKKFYNNNQAISQNVTKVNEVFRERLDLEYDLILHRGTRGGYCLNKDELKIFFET